MRPWQKHEQDNPKKIDERARQLVRLSKLDDAGCYQTPNDFDECVELVKKKIILSKPSDFDYELDDLILRRSLLQFELKYGLKWSIPKKLLYNRGGDTNE